MVSVSHPQGCTCNVCSGPAVWNSVLNASLPSLPPPADLKPGPRKLFRQHVHHKGDSFSTAVAEKEKEKDVEGQRASLKQDLVTDSILCGHTKSPITLEDLTAFLRSSNSGDRSAELIALDFLMLFKDYKTKFFALPVAQQAPHPYSVIESLSKLSTDNPNPPPAASGIQSEASPVTFKTDFGNSETPVQLPSQPPAAVVQQGPSGRNRSGSSASSSSIPLNRQSAHTRAVMMDATAHDEDDDHSSEASHSRSRSRSNANRQSLTLPMILDPETQPLRAELQVIIDNFLSGPSSTLLMTIVTPSAISLALSETELTTHPSTLEPIATALTAHLNARVIPQFFHAAVINLSKATARGRLLMAIFILLIGVALSTVFIVERHIFPRWSRLALTPFYVASIGYMIGSQTSLCFWLAWRGTREAKTYEEEERAALTERGLRSSDEATLYDLADLGLFRPRSDESASNVKTYSIYTINRGAKFSPLKTLRFDSTKRAQSFHMVTSMPPPDRRERLIRMTGTATSTVPVEDPSVRRAQLQIAVKVTSWLFVGTVLAMTVVILIP